MEKELIKDGIRLLLRVTEENDCLIVEMEAENLVGDQLLEGFRKNSRYLLVVGSPNFYEYYKYQTSNELEGKLFDFKFVKGGQTVFRGKKVFTKIKSLDELLTIVMRLECLSEKVRLEWGDLTVKNSYDIQFKHKPNVQLIKNLNGKIIHINEKTNYVYASLREEDVEVLRENGEIESIKKNNGRFNFWK